MFTELIDCVKFEKLRDSPGTSNFRHLVTRESFESSTVSATSNGTSLEIVTYFISCCYEVSTEVQTSYRIHML